MLANLLSRKGIFTQIILGALFFFLFFGKLHDEKQLFGNIWGIMAFVVTVILCALFFASSKLFKAAGLAFWFYLIWTLAFSEIAINMRFSVSLLCCTILFWRMIHAEEKADSKNYAFDVGVCLSISSLFYPPSFFIIGLILFNYLYMQSLNLRVIILFLLGFLIPSAAGIQILYLTNNMSWFLGFDECFCLDFWKSTSIIWLIPVGLFVIISWLDHVSNSGKQDINKRHIYFLFFLYFINWIIILILFGGTNINSLAVLGLPISAFIARHVQYQNSNVWKETIVLGFLATLVAFYFRAEIIETWFELFGNVSF